MHVIVTDRSNRTIPPQDLPHLALWNETMGHVCATALNRIRPKPHQDQAG